MVSDRVSEHRGPMLCGLEQRGHTCWTASVHTHREFIVPESASCHRGVGAGGFSVVHYPKTADSEGCVGTSSQAVLPSQAKVQLFPWPHSKHHCA